MTTMEDTSQNQQENKEKEECPTCGLNVGVGIALHIAKMAEVEAEDIEKDLMDQKITVQEAMDKLKSRLPDEFHRGLVEEVEGLMKKEIEEIEEKAEIVKKDPYDEISKRKEAFCFTATLKEKGMIKDLDAWIKDKEKIVSGLPESDFAEAQKTIIESLKRAREAIKNVPPCEV